MAGQGGAVQEAFRDRAGAWLEEHVSREWREQRGALSEDDQTRLRRDWDRTLFEGGYSGLSLPTEFGGQGLGMAEEVIFGELAARAQAPDGLARIGKILTAPTLIAHGTARQKDQYLRPIVEGKSVWCQGFSEPGSGSDLASVRCAATTVSGGYLVKGTKTWTSYSRQADRCLLLARTDEVAPRHHNLSLLLVDMKQPGVSLSPIRQISGTSHFTETRFDDVFVAEEDRVGDENDGWRMAMTVLANERGTVEAVARYVEIRADLDVLRGCCGADSIPSVQLDRLDARVELIRWQVSKAVSRLDDRAAYDAASMILKVGWSELWQEIAGLGAQTTCPRHRAHWRFQYLETRSATIYSGTSEIQRNIIAERVLGLPAMTATSSEVELVAGTRAEELPEVTVVCGEVGEAGASAVRELCARHVASLPMADYVVGEAMPWRVLADGGWDLLGVPEGAGGGGGDLRDLVEVAIAWGESIVPLPLVPTLLTKRWVAAARDHDGPVTFAVSSPATPGRQTAPFAGVPGAAVVTGTGTGAAVRGPVQPTDLEDDGYAPSLRLATTSLVTDWTPEAVPEALAMWAGEAAGCARRTLRDAVAYAKERTQFGQPIGRFQAVKHHLADAHIMAERAETAAIWAAVQPDRATMASTAAFDAAIGCIEIAIQVHGGLGFTWEMGVHFPLRHVVALRELATGLVGP